VGDRRLVYAPFMDKLIMAALAGALAFGEW
jgi:hypothetical protein